MNLTRTTWKGWNPSQDRNGDPDYLLRMDNLLLDELGTISLVRGFRQLGGDFPDFVSDLYSTTLIGEERLYVGLNLGRQILRNNVDFTGTTVVISENGGSRPCFGNSLGQVYACSGLERKKDNGSTILDLGLETPTNAPSVGTINQPRLDLSNSWTLVEGEQLTGGNTCFVDEDTLRGVIQAAQGVNTLTIGSVSAADDPANDRFYFLCQLENSDHFTKIRVEIECGDAENFYWKEWPVDVSVFKLGLAQQTILGCRRDEFVRQGNDTGKDWSSVSKVKVIGEATAASWFLADEMRFMGGGEGQLNGLYEYKAVNVFNNGIYTAKSGTSPSSGPKLIINGRAEVIAPTTSDTQVEEVWIYRRSLATSEHRRHLSGEITDDIIQPLLDQFYRVGVTTPGGTLTEELSDISALELNIKLNEFIVSVEDITEPFIGIEGLKGERQLYLTRSFLYLSERLNPDGVDTQFTQKASGDPSEINLWIKKVTNDLYILATTKDLYEVSGTFLDNPDGTIDINIRGMGEEYPPICADCALHSIDGIGSIFYIAADGWRVTTGSNSALISPQLTQLFQNKSRYGIPPIVIYPGDVARYAIAVGRNKLFCVSQHNDGTRRLFVYDLVHKYWRLQYIDPIYVHATETDRLLLGFGETGSGFNLIEMEVGDDASVVSDQPTHGQGFHFETVLDHNGQPRNRKDTFTLKLVMDTGGVPVSVFIARNEISSDGDWVNLGNYSTTTQDTIYIQLDDSLVTLGFRYALKITNSNNEHLIFKLYEATIEYDPRPEQLNYLRIQNTNLGTLARKRFVSYAFVIDTLGNNVTFTPYIDNVSKTSTTVNKLAKLTYIHFFTDEQLGTDIGGILDGGPFEFYQLNLEETISEKLPTPTKYLVIPANDYGNPNRKRHTSYKFQINTRSASVRFTPKVDGTTYTTLDFNTSEKRTVEYFFNTSLDVTGIDIGGILETLADTEFEFYGVIIPQHLEILPDRLKSFYPPHENFGIAARKRIRTLPLILDTRSSNVVFTPIVDGIELDSSTFNTSRKQTVYHYFTDDVFGTDYGGKFIGTNPFEFYGFGKPEDVEVLPVPKKYDQLQIMRFDKIGKLFNLRLRLIATGSTTEIPFSLYSDEEAILTQYDVNAKYSGTLQVSANRDQVYQIDLPKSVNGTIFRLVLGPTEDPFHRYDCLARVALSGMQSDPRWIPFR